MVWLLDVSLIYTGLDNAHGVEGGATGQCTCPNPMNHHNLYSHPQNSRQPNYPRHRSHPPDDYDMQVMRRKRNQHGQLNAKCARSLQYSSALQTCGAAS